MEKRAFTRQTLHHPAQYSSPNRNPHPCLIKDFCKKGLFIALQQNRDEPPLTVGDPLFIDFQSSGILQLTYRLHARIARIVEGAMGLEITHDNPEALHALYKLARIPATALAQVSAKDLEKVGQQGRELIEAFFTRQIHNLFEQIDTALLEKTRVAGSNAEECAFADAAKTFKAYDQRIEKSFCDALLAQVDNWLAGRTVTLPESGQHSKAASLSLVGKEDFEDWLLVKVITNRADQHYKATLYPLQRRMSEVSATRIEEHNNPISPTSVVHAFYQAIAPLNLSREIMQTVLNTLESQLIADGLKRLYRRLDQLFIDHQILPVIPYQPVKSEAARKPGPGSTRTDTHSQPGTPLQSDSTQSTAATTQMTGAETETKLQQATARSFSAVQNLIALQNPPGLDPASGMHTQAADALPTDQLLTQLTRLQPSLINDLENNPALSLNERIRQCIGASQPLSERDHLAIDLTDQFFQSLARNAHLAETIKPALKQLEIPLLKIFIKDKSFFADETHPARQVLNRLAQLGQQATLLNPKAVDKILKAIDKICLEFNDDTRVFSEAADTLGEFITQQVQTSQRNTDRLIKSCEGLETIEKAKYTVRTFIEQTLSGKVLPKVVVDLVNRGWQELLVFTLLRDGQGSAVWKSYTDVIQRLSRINSPDDLTGLQQQASGLLKIIEIGIREAPANQAQLKKLAPLLRALFTQAPESNPPVFVEADPLLALAADAFNYIDDADIQSKALSRWVRRARNLEVGSWVEYRKTEENGPAIQMRLAWIGQDHHKFVFVNHQGMKVVELLLKKMAEQLQSGLVRRIDDPDQPFVDQNLDAMVQDMYDRMNHQATHDELTGLINRKEFERQLGHTLTDARQNWSQHVLCHLDLDQFKVVNTTCGHEAGDLLLQQIGELLIQHLLPPHIVAHAAGDEFLLIFKNCDIQSARSLTLSLKEAIQAHRFQCREQTYTVGASAGLVRIDEASESVASLINAADSARLSAKEAGRNKVHVYQLNDKEQAARQEIMQRVARLNKALDEERLRLRCQKISPSQNDGAEKLHYEILLSVEDEFGIHLAPGEFIHAAERYNRMQAIDRWVIRTVFQWTRDHREHLEQVDCLTINLSGHSLNDETLMDFILDELLATEVPRDKLCFEVTETTAVTNLDDAIEVISELKELGFKFALDDFGTGLSSYKYLKKLPVDYLKIDGSFVRAITDSPQDLAMVQSINEMAHLMGKKTIAEYVENEAIAKQLRAIGVDFLQGFHIEKPIPLAVLPEQMTTRAVAG